MKGLASTNMHSIKNRFVISSSVKHSLCALFRPENVRAGTVKDLMECWGDRMFVYGLQPLPIRAYVIAKEQGQPLLSYHSGAHHLGT